jgi:hypothetical protein
MRDSRGTTHRVRRLLARLTALLLIAPSAAVLSQTLAHAAAACGAATVTATRTSSPVLWEDTTTSPLVNSMYEAYRITNTSGAAYTDLWVATQDFGATAKIKPGTYESGRTHIGALAAGASKMAFSYLTSSVTAKNQLPTAAESHNIGVYTTRPDLAASPLCTTASSMYADFSQNALANKVNSVVSGPKPPQLGGIMTITVTGNTGTVGGSGTFVTSPAVYPTWPASSYQLTTSSIVMTSGSSSGNNRTDNDTLYLTGLNSADSAYTATFTFVATGATTAPTTVSPMSHIESGGLMKHTADSTTGAALPPIDPTVSKLSVSGTLSPTSLPYTGGTSTWTLTLKNTGNIASTLDDITLGLPTSPGTPAYAGGATFNGAAVTGAQTSGASLVFPGTWTIPAGGTSTFVIPLTLPAASGSYALTAIGHVGSVQIDTTEDATDSAAQARSVTVSLPPPTVASVTPSTGISHGGTSVTVTGTNFTGATAVSFGGSAATSFTVVDATHLTATAPSGTPLSTVDIRITNGSGTSTTSAADLYTYSAAPNNPPAFTAAAANTAQTIHEGDHLAPLAATDPDGDSLTYSTTDALPAGMTLNAGGTFSGTAATGTAGSYTVVVTVDDGQAAVNSTATASLTITVVAPITAHLSVASPTNDPTPDITATTTASDAATATLTIGGQTYTAAPSAGALVFHVTTPLAEGSYAVNLSVDDGLGTPATDSATLVVDTTPPTLTLAVPASTGDTTPTISGSTNARPGAIVTVSVNGHTYTGPVSVSGTFDIDVTDLLTDGSYAVSATVSDLAGNPATATATLVVSTFVPTVTLDHGGLWLTQDSSPSISGTTDASDGSAVSIDVGGLPVTGTVSAGAFSVPIGTTLADGDYAVDASVTDGGTGSDSQTLRIDTTPYTIGIAGGASTTTNTDPPVIGGTTNAPSGTTVAVTIGGTTHTTTATNVGTWSLAWPAGLGNGTATVGASVTDAAGNTATDSQQLTVDMTGPSLTVDAVVTNDTTPDVTGTTSAADGTLVTVTVDGQSFTGPVSGGSYAVGVGPLVEGVFGSTATVSDGLGHATTMSSTVTVDLTGPSVLVNGQAVNTSSTHVTGTTDAPDGSTVTVGVGGGSYTGTVSGGAYSVLVGPLADAAYSVDVTIADAVGNPTTGHGSLEVDTTGPSLTAVSQTTSDPTPDIGGTTDAAAGSTVTVVVDGTTYPTVVQAAGTYSVTVGPLGDGAHSVTVTVTDALANPTTVTPSLVVDTTGPTVTVPTISSNVDTVTVTATTDAPYGTPVTVTVDGVDYPTSVGFGGLVSVVVGPLADGTHGVTVTTTDALGNGTTTTSSIVVDTTPPTVTIVGAPTILTNASSGTFTGTSTEPAGTVVTVTVNGVTQTTTVQPDGTYSVPWPPLPSDGAYPVTVSITDALGNTSTATQTVVIDRTPPVIAIDGGLAVTLNVTAGSATATITGTTDAPPGSTVVVLVDGVAYTTVVLGNGTYTTAPIPGLTDGDHPVTVSVTDAAGNGATATQTLHVHLSTATGGSPGGATTGGSTGGGGTGGTTSGGTTGGTHPGGTTGGTTGEPTAGGSRGTGTGTAAPGRLSRTGSPTGVIVAVGLLLMLAGGTAVVAARRAGVRVVPPR